MIRNTAGQDIAADLVAVADGSPVTTGTTTVYVEKDGGTQATGSGTVTHQGNGSWKYEPTQAETDAAHIKFSWRNSLATPVGINVYTRPSGTGFPVVDASNRVDVSKISGMVVASLAAAVSSPTTTTFDVDSDEVLLAGFTSMEDIQGTIALIIGESPRVVESVAFVSGTTWTVTVDYAYPNTPAASDVVFLKLPGVAMTSAGRVKRVTTTDTASSANVTQISGDSAAADNLEAAADGTGYNLGGGSIVAASVTGAVGSVTGNVGGNVGGSVGSISGVTFPANFATLGINASGHITRVVLTDTATTLTNAPSDSSGTTTLLSRLTSTRAGYLDNLTNLDATVSSRLAGASYTAPDNAGISTISSNITTLLNRIGAWTGTGVNTILGAFKALLSKDASTPSDIGGTFAASTDSTEAIRDRGDAAWTGGGGTADWTADERTAIRSILGVPGSGTTPVTPTTGMLDTINDNIAALSAGSGSGAFVVTITVTDGTSPLENATVRLTEGVNSFRATTNVSGVATFSLNAATYTRSITKDGYTFTPNTLVVAGATSSTSAMTATVVSGSPGPGLISKTITVLDWSGAPIANVPVTFTLTVTPTGVNAQVVDGNSNTRVSNVNGEITYTFIRNATYQLRSGLTGEVITFLVPGSGDFTIPSFRRVT